MQKRVAAAILTAAVAILSLAGCQASGPGTFGSADARADVAIWTHDAETTLGLQASTVRFDGYETCRTDRSYFATSSEWRTVTSLGIPRARQSAAIAALSTAFVGRKWSRTTPPGLVRLDGPKGALHTGQIQIERGTGSTLVISVISPCYG